MDKEKSFQLSKTVYGPVQSWRFGLSLGIDPLFHTSTCSFNCCYCQLGHIQNITTEIKVFVPTQKVLEDYKTVTTENEHKGQNIDIIMFSGSGEPCLAANLGEISLGLRQLSPSVPQAVLTNAVHLSVPLVQKNLQGMDKVVVKVDAFDEEMLHPLNRPAEGVTLKSILEGVHSFKKGFGGEIETQTMIMSRSKKHIDSMCRVLAEINPQTVQLNTPPKGLPPGMAQRKSRKPPGIPRSQNTKTQANLPPGTQRNRTTPTNPNRPSRSY